MDTEVAIDRFLASPSLSDATRRAYRADLRDFGDWLTSQGLDLDDVDVRVLADYTAELGRARMPSAQVVGMPTGSVVELNQAADEPIDLYVNGTLFATGRLMVVDGTDWAVRIETVLSSSNTSSESQMEVARWPESW